MNPTILADKIETRLRDYIVRTMPITRSVPALENELRSLFDNKPLLQSPYLELIPPYKSGQGSALSELANANVIHRETAEVFAKSFGLSPEHCKLYEHQKNAVTDVVQKGKHLVVCSGTGSGKTESFLIPIIDSIIKEKEAGTLNPGIRAIILYPMNALVNDQIRRLRGILRNSPEITFGKFTGETQKESELDTNWSDNSDAFGCLDQGNADAEIFGFDGESALPNEVTHRKRWKEAPAHILVTNYSMLERLLLDPQYDDLFGETLRHVTLDEAHCYTGAVGTEIAWLIRRLKHRAVSHGCDASEIRFLATSATLISDPQLNNDEKAERIRSEFAAKLFPANKDNVSVQFGIHQERPQAPAGLGDRSAEDYNALKNSPCPIQLKQRIQEGNLGSAIQLDPDVSLFEATQNLLGVGQWLDSIGKALQKAPPDGEETTANSNWTIEGVCYFSTLMTDCHHSGMVTQQSDPADWDLLAHTGENTATFRALTNFVFAGRGGSTALDSWRTILHDYSENKRSSVAGDVDRNQRRRFYGNRLDLLETWQDWENPQTTQITVKREPLSYLLRSAQDLAITLEQEEDTEFYPLTQPVIPSQAFLDGIQCLRNQLESLKEELENCLQETVRAWKQILNKLKFVGNLEQLFANWLQEDGAYYRLIEQLHGALDTPDDADKAKFGKTAAIVFPKQTDENSTARNDALAFLIALGTIAKAPQSRTPLIDIRYHQLARGIQDVGVYFEPSDDPQLIAKFTHQEGSMLHENEPSQAIYNLGVCRECGQPFAMGYTEFLTLDHVKLQQGVPLLRQPTHSHKFLHAFAWVIGKELDDQEQDPEPDCQNVHLDPSQPMVSSNHQNPSIKVFWKCEAADNENPEFITQCPCCQNKQNINNQARFGIITPFEAKGQQLKNTALDELFYRTTPSIDPAARKHPGNGRKVLAFSDSRSGAAKLAVNFQRTYADVFFSRAIKQALADFVPYDVDNCPAYVIERILDQNPVFRKVEENEREAALSILIPYHSTIDVDYLANETINIAQNENLGRLLEGTDEHGAELDESIVCKKIIEQMLVHPGRNSLRRRGIIDVDVSNIQKPQNGIQVEDAVFEELLSRVIEFLLRRAEVTGHPSLQFREFYSRAGEIDDTQSFASGAAISALNRLARAALLHDPSSWANSLFNLLDAAGTNPYRSMRTALVALQPDQKVNILQSIEDDAAFSDAIIAATNQDNGPALKTVKGQLNKNLRNKAKEFLEQIWPILTPPNGNPPFLEAENNKYSIQLSNLRFKAGARSQLSDAWHDKELKYLDKRNLVAARIEEHTAQINQFKGSAYQQAFAAGQIGILSCSTTFEMGVDLGDLSCVFLANLPPHASNYRQRAGRAGRRPGAPAYVLSFVGDSSHDRYFWDHTPELLFGPVEPPRIYLENKTFRARHLRAEALHDFLIWAEGEKNVFGTKANQSLIQIRRSWMKVRDLFIGKRSGRRNGQNYPVASTFDALIDTMPDWFNRRANEIDRSVLNIDDIPEPLDYSVAKDLAWQCLGGAIYAPFDLSIADKLNDYRLLGGPNLPKINAAKQILEQDSNFSRSPLTTQIHHYFANIGSNLNNPNSLSGAQAHLLNEDSIKWLTRFRILPKYGFPVDVISLLPHPSDEFGNHVKMERDLKIGLYEYAPGKQVSADKRIFESDKVQVFQQGGIQAAAAINNQTIPVFKCADCSEVTTSPQIDQHGQNKCPACRELVHQQPAIKPDAFLAKHSTSANLSKFDKNPPSRIQRFTGGTRNEQLVKNTSLQTKESEDGTILYINEGPAGRGFNQDGSTFYLIHEVRTDIAVWHPLASAFDNLPQPLHANERRRNAFISALQAILRASAKILQVNDRDLAGIVHDTNDPGRPLEFVLFDDSDGGGGAVIPLVLLGGNPLDDERDKLIDRILNEALSICLCAHCQTQGPTNQNMPDVALVPNSLSESLAKPGNNREYVSCYNCLKSYSNQFYHEKLDRYDAWHILKSIRANSGTPQSEADQPNAETGEGAVRPAKSKVPPPPTQPTATFLPIDPNVTLLPGTYKVQIGDAEIVGRLNPRTSPMTFNYGENKACPITREQVIAKKS